MLCRLGNYSRLRGGCNVLAAKRVQADSHKFAKHAGSVSNGIDLGAVIMGPGNRDLRYPQSVPLCQEENLWIESPAFDLHIGKNRSGCLVAEGLEATLSIHIGQTQNRA